MSLIPSAAELGAQANAVAASAIDRFGGVLADRISQAGKIEDAEVQALLAALKQDIADAYADLASLEKPLLDRIDRLTALLERLDGASLTLALRK